MTRRRSSLRGMMLILHLDCYVRAAFSSTKPIFSSEFLPPQCVVHTRYLFWPGCSKIAQPCLASRLEYKCMCSLDHKSVLHVLDIFCVWLLLLFIRYGCTLMACGMSSMSKHTASNRIFKTFRHAGPAVIKSQCDGLHEDHEIAFQPYKA